MTTRRTSSPYYLFKSEPSWQSMSFRWRRKCFSWRRKLHRVVTAEVLRYPSSDYNIQNKRSIMRPGYQWERVVLCDFKTGTNDNEGNVIQIVLCCFHHHTVTNCPRASTSFTCSNPSYLHATTNTNKPPFCFSACFIIQLCLKDTFYLTRWGQF